MSGPYVVFDEGRLHGEQYLALDGPFAYPRWVGQIVRAEGMQFARAHMFANAYGSRNARVVAVPVALAEAS